MMQTVISTMQDLDFVIDKADFMLRLCYWLKVSWQAVVTMSVTVKDQRARSKLLVRVNAQYGVSSVEDPANLPRFFCCF